MLWTSIDSFSKFGVRFLISLVIARILSPSDFGMIGMLTVFITVSESLINSGFSQALMRKKDRTPVDCSTVFYFNLVASVTLYCLLYIFAPNIAAFYNLPFLCQLLRILGIILLIDSFGVVQRALYQASLDFKTVAKISLTSAVVSGLCSIYMALHGYGVWALVVQQLVGAGLRVSLYWVFSKWRPILRFSWKSFKEMFAFGINLMISGLIDTIYKNMYSLVIGKVFSPASLGQYSRASHFANLPSSQLTLVMQRVTYPVLCNIQDEDERLRKNYRLLIRMSSFFVFPGMCLMAGVSYSFIETAIGVKWHYAASLLIPLCFARMWYPIHALNLNLLKVKGRTDLFLRLEIIKKVIGVLVLIISLPFGLTFMAWCIIGNSIISLFINTYYTGKLINVGFFTQMRDILPTLLLSLLIFAVVFMESFVITCKPVHLIVGIISGFALYYAAVKLFNFSEYEYFLQIIKNRKKKSQL